MQTSRGRPGHYRLHARIPARLRALVARPGGGWSCQAPIEDIGLGGARVRVGEALRAGEPVIVSLTAPTLWDPLVVAARVAWVSSGEPPVGVGLAFAHTNGGAVYALYELIATLLGYD